MLVHPLQHTAARALRILAGDDEHRAPDPDLQHALDPLAVLRVVGIEVQRCGNRPADPVTCLDVLTPLPGADCSLCSPQILDADLRQRIRPLPWLNDGDMVAEVERAIRPIAAKREPGNSALGALAGDLQPQATTVAVHARRLGSGHTQGGELSLHAITHAATYIVNTDLGERHRTAAKSSFRIVQENQ
ncbi:hypothetical protein GCM10007888_45700 [Methylobacterium oxalidis]|uniref:UbiC transcription regulator-associated domain-containing protein n=1 Tax=Methylobacterium oxalidis TaxID=944322 RepID=A0ABQ6DPZ8_9HYPH|nr:hypothetical protein GCM10007888_45700 [Methylobacterium oxalidis]